MVSRAFCDHVFVRRLSELQELNAADERALLELMGSGRKVAKGEDIVADGSAPSFVWIVVSGAACRYKVLSGGYRQILGFLFPGDMAHDLSSGSNVLDHGISASTPCTVGKIRRQEFEQVLETHPNIARALSQYCFTQAALYRSWLVNTRRRSAPERLAYLFCEQFTRLQTVGVAKFGAPIPLHIVQSDLADAAGMSMVHLNRALQKLRSWKLVGRDSRQLDILDWEGLKELAEFNPDSLHPPRAKLPPRPFQTSGEDWSDGPGFLT
jgi:CRP-like cAMP-binding protein